jgi:hypothetical protein
MGDKEDAEDTLSFLEAVEAGFRRMIGGVFRFVFIRLPTWLYECFSSFFDWLGRFLRMLWRITVRLARILFFAAIWCGLVFGPLAATLVIEPASGPAFRIPAGCWAALSLIGSVWGLARWRRQLAAQAAAAPPGSPRNRAGKAGGCLALLGLLFVMVLLVPLVVWLAFSAESFWRGPGSGPGKWPSTSSRYTRPY